MSSKAANESSQVQQRQLTSKVKQARPEKQTRNRDINESEWGTVFGVIEIVLIGVEDGVEFTDRSSEVQLLHHFLHRYSIQVRDNE